MAKTRAKKEEEFKNLLNALEGSEVVIFTAQSGIKVTDTQNLRSEQKAKGSKVITVKKTLLSKALSEKGFESPLVDAKGLISVTIDYADPITPAKIITKYQKDFDGLEIIGGIYEGKVVDASMIKELSVLPTFEEAIAKFMFAMKAVGDKFVATLDALREKREEEENSSKKEENKIEEVNNNSQDGSNEENKVEEIGNNEAESAEKAE